MTREISTRGYKGEIDCCAVQRKFYKGGAIYTPS